MRLFINFKVKPSIGTLNIGTAEHGSSDVLTRVPRTPRPRRPSRRRGASSRERRVATLVVTAGLFVSVFVLRELSMSKRDALSVLYVIPVAILALEYGLRAGFLAAVGASAAVAVWLTTRDLPFEGTPLAVRAGILFAVGIIAGWFSDQMRASSAAVESENERLSTLEHDQAALQAEVEQMRHRLGAQLRNASRVIERQERERRGIAQQLHEDAAQAMAAALVTVGLLERRTERELTRAQFDEVRSQVRSSIADLRRIATSLRPALLDEMGLESALLRIGELEEERHRRTVRFATDALAAPLPSDAEASVYRVVEEVFAALDGQDRVEVRLSTPGEAIEVVVDARGGGGDRGDGGELERLRTALLETRARVELIGGSLRVGPADGDGVRVVAAMPLRG